jgi:hypothetical protein
VRHIGPIPRDSASVSRRSSKPRGRCACEARDVSHHLSGLLSYGQPSLGSRTSSLCFPIPQLAETGLVCHTKVNIRVGNALCVLFWGNIPFILRPLEAGVFCYAGQAFVLGIMDREALQQGRELEWITLV